MFKSKNSKNLLMVCYYYPPIIDVGSKRSVAFSKYLVKYGWTPYVLSVKNPDKAYCNVGKEIPPLDVKVTYAYSLINLSKFVGKLNGLISRVLRFINVNYKKNIIYELICIPDRFIGWIPLAVVKGFKIIKNYNIDLIYVSCSPHSAAIIGVILKKIYKIPFIVDFRDPFTYELSSQSRKFRQRINNLFEKKILKICDMFIVTTDETRCWYESKYPFVKSKIYTIHNGFDHSNIKKISGVKKFPKFTIFYGGNLYIDKTLNEFFEALKMLSMQNKVEQCTFQFIYHGMEAKIVQKMAMEYNVQDLVVTKQLVPYEENLLVLARSHLQLLRIIKPMISTKLFEGLALNTLFLATIPSGEVEHIIRRFSSASYIVKLDCDSKPTETISQIGEAILDAMEKYKSDKITNNLVEEFLDEFSRENLTLKLIRVISENLGVQNNSSTIT